MFRPLPLGSITAAGWLQRQLRIQANGLTGHLDEFWPDVAESQWFGGKAEGWERAPYWLDGIIPLAWALDDQGLKEGDPALWYVLWPFRVADVDGGSKVRRGAAEFCSAGLVKVSLGNGLCRGMLWGDVQRPHRFRLASLRR